MEIREVNLFLYTFFIQKEKEEYKSHTKKTQIHEGKQKRRTKSVLIFLTK